MGDSMKWCYEGEEELKNIKESSLEKRNRELNEQLDKQSKELKDLRSFVKVINENFESIKHKYTGHKQMSLGEYAKEAYENSKAKGFHDDANIDDNFTIPTRLALLHSEVSEVLEEIRKGKKMSDVYYSEGGKIEGPLAECADIFIRLMDLVGRYAPGEKFEQVVREKMKYNKTRPFKHNKSF